MHVHPTPARAKRRATVLGGALAALLTLVIAACGGTGAGGSGAPDLSTPELQTTGASETMDTTSTETDTTQ